MPNTQRPDLLAQQIADEKAASIESQLLDYTKRLARHSQGRRAIVIHLSRLRPDNRRAHHIRIAANTFEALVKQFDGQIFLLQNADIVFVCRDASIAVIDDAIMRLRYLFGDDPLAAELDDGVPDRFATWYDIERDYQEFLAWAEEVYEQEVKRKKRLAAIVGGAPREERQPMDPPALAELVGAIQSADLTNVMRRQAICAIMGDETPRPVFREVYISIADLGASIMPKRDIASDRWLFQHLTQHLDRRVLSMLRRNDDPAIAHSYSLNLNISTLLSQEFLQFDQSLRGGARGTIVIELQKVDIFADIGAFVFAREYLRERGYRVCLDGLSSLTLSFIERDRLGLDLVKLFWSPDMADAMATQRITSFRDAVERTGRSRIILARCDGEEAVRFGQSLGLRLFQGRYIDRLLGGAGSPGPRLRPPA
jgi:EAL domain-containing protein (putative c-di-GMP-specific phosphodiesterase class I)